MSRTPTSFGVAVFATLALLLGAQVTHATPVTLTFDEFSVGQLDGTTVYEPFGITDFENVSQTVSSLFIDGVGITNAPGTTGAIDFASVVTDISFSWVTSGAGVNFMAEAFDTAGNLLDTFFFDGSNTSEAQVGIGSLAGLDVARIEFQDGAAQVAIDTLSYVIVGNVGVAEPGVLALFGLGLCGLGAATRRQRAATA
ncbi:MAG: PEP-CTERM sorting domain-containing protein [Pseudomonadota bacterium]